MEVDDEPFTSEARDEAAVPATETSAATTPPSTGTPFQKLDPRALTAALWAGAITFGVVIGPLGLGALITLVALLLSSHLLGAAIVAAIFAGVAVLFGFLCFYWPRLVHRRVAYRVDRRGLEILRGVVWRSHIFIARSRVQHTDVSQGPLQRRFGLARLIVHTAGTQNASTGLSGVAYEEAMRIRGRLTEDEEGELGQSAEVHRLDDGV